MLLALALCACDAVPSMSVTEEPAPQEETDAGFQRHLDRLGIEYSVPKTGKAILVNIPAFELIAFEDGAPAFRSRIIVGSRRNPTPRLTSHVSSVRFRPTWRPTPAMVASGEYRDRVWPPGRRNPLGLAAVRLEPGLLVYLHDTNRRGLFDRTDRALSHGCVRVKRWDELSAWVLGIDLVEVHAVANGRATVDVAAPAIPVTLGYFTRFPDDDGTVREHDDIYRLGATASAGAPLANGIAGTCTAPAASG